MDSSLVGVIISHARNSVGFILNSGLSGSMDNVLYFLLASDCPNEQ
jgi:hypothetical protein